MIRGLEGGVDDYLTKPFSTRELIARIKTVLRRAGVSDEAPLTIGPLTLEPSSHRVRAGEEKIDLGPTEFRLLQFFMQHPDRVFARDQYSSPAQGARAASGSDIDSNRTWCGLSFFYSNISGTGGIVSNPWIRELWRMAALFGGALFFGWLLGVPHGTFTLALIVYLSWHLYNLYRLPQVFGVRPSSIFISCNVVTASARNVCL